MKKLKNLLHAPTVQCLQAATLYWVDDDGANTNICC